MYHDSYIKVSPSFALQNEYSSMDTIKSIIQSPKSYNLSILDFKKSSVDFSYNSSSI
jgi:hypothetical protein